MQLKSALRDWWREQAHSKGALGAGSLLARELWNFALDSTPERRRQRYGDMEYDWEHRVNTTTGTVGWRERLLGVFHSPYMPTDPAEFRAMIESIPIDMKDGDLHNYTFIDIGSGKGRTLLLASEYPFRKIVGVELIPGLHRAAEENVRVYFSSTNSAANIELICQDARDFEFPLSPLVIYLFNPLPEPGLRALIAKIERSWQKMPRNGWVLYHNPLIEHVLTESSYMHKEKSDFQFSLYKIVTKNSLAK